MNNPSLKALYFVLGAIILILLFRLLSSDGGISDYFSLQKKLETLESQVQALQTRNEDLKHKVYVLQTQTNSVETIARQKLGMIGKDEVFIKVIELPSQSHSTQSHSSDLKDISASNTAK